MYGSVYYTDGIAYRSCNRAVDKPLVKISAS